MMWGNLWTVVGGLREEPAKQKSTLQETSLTKALGQECGQGTARLSKVGGWGGRRGL